MKQIIKNVIALFLPGEPQENFLAAHEAVIAQLKYDNAYLKDQIKESNETADEIKRLTWENQLLTQRLQNAEKDNQQLLQRLNAEQQGAVNNTIGILNHTINVLAANRVISYDGLGNPQVEPVIESEITRILGSNIIEDCLKKIKKSV